ncbi:iron complex transport system substrate-binding protein [Saccharopolyspora lacisalsi]|uniref:Iron complex transport system substrate-binding protein n=1 Tax=Halosaccharopolyspora lacisalsi TaxID=1000566 RepID=A0A839E252_9PSEU|nr:ABC transporter substrate-binding protein [Halosaccharopolyspora lacisalsi]MBA8825827.1 iron complex transport system substrate-binding protein [Halosaccharopolyspora lacisalsi]
MIVRTGTTRLRRLTALLTTVMALLVGVTACATRQQPDEPPAPGNDAASGFPTRVTIGDQEPVTLAEQPKRIVSLSPSATETLYAIGAGEQVVAVGKNSDHPERAPQTPMSALSVSTATVAGYEPDLVILPAGSTELAEGLRAVDVSVLPTPSASGLDAAYRQIEALGNATGHSDQARRTTRRMRSDIAEIVADTPKPSRPLSYYHEISPSFYTTTSRSFVGEVYGLFGLTNIADSAGGKFPQLSEEHILQADPDLIFMADTKSAGVTANAATARPGWGSLSAVRAGNVFELNDDVASRWGPRVVDFARAISKAVARAQNG